MTAPVAGYTRWYLRREEALRGVKRVSTASHIADDAETPMCMRPSPGNYPKVRTYSGTPAGDVFLGSWVSPALKAGTYSGKNVKLMIGSNQDTDAASANFKHYLYLLRDGAYHSDILAAVTSTDELPLLYNGGSDVLYLQYASSNYDSNRPVGSLASNLYRAQGISTGAFADCRLCDRVGLYLWRSGDPEQYWDVKLRSAIAGADLATTRIYAKDVSNAIGAQSTDQTINDDGYNTSLESEVTYICQSVTAGATGASGKARFILDKVGSPTGHFVFHIRATQDGPNLATGYLNFASISTKAGYEIDFHPALYIASGTTFYVVGHILGTVDSSNRLRIYWNSTNPYAGGQMWISSNYGGSWTSYPTYDFALVSFYTTSLIYSMIYAYFDKSLRLEPSTQYYLLSNGHSTDDPYHWLSWGSDSSGGYAGADNFARYSADGVTWTDEAAVDFIFELYYTLAQNTAAYFRANQHTASGVTITVQDGDQIVYELLGTSLGVAQNLHVSFNGAEGINSNAHVLQEPYSYIEINADILMLWDDLLERSGTQVMPIVDIETTPRLKYSVLDISNINRPVVGNLLDADSLDRTIGDEYGEYSIGDMMIRISDHTRYLQSLLTQQALTGNTAHLVGRRANVSMLLVNGALIDWRQVFTGRIDGYDCGESHEFTLRIKADDLLADSVPIGRVTLAEFPHVPIATIGAVIPWYMGDWSHRMQGILTDSIALEYLMTVGWQDLPIVYQNQDYTHVLLEKREFDTVHRPGYSFYRDDSLGIYGYASFVRMFAPPTSVQFQIQGTVDYPLQIADVTNPIDRMHAFLLLCSGLMEGAYDMRTLARLEDTPARNYLLRSGITFGGGVSAAVTLSTLLKEWNRSFDVDWFINRDGILAIAYAQFAGLNEYQAQFSAAEILHLSAAVGSRWSEGNIVNYYFDDSGGAQGYVSSGAHGGFDNPNDPVIVDETDAKWINIGPAASALVSALMAKRTPPEPQFFTVTLPLRAFGLELGGIVILNHPSAYGSQGLIAHECIVRGMRYGFGPTVDLTVRSNDVPNKAILGDENDMAATWANASAEDRRYLYAADETDYLIADGQYAKQLCDDPTETGRTYR